MAPTDELQLTAAGTNEQLTSALSSMLAALDEQTSPLAALLGANTGGPPESSASHLEPATAPSGLMRGATAAVGEGVRADELLVRAASRGDLAMVRDLLDRGAVAAARNHYLLTALHWAVTLGHTQVVELLLERGTPINAQDAEGHTPLHMAAREGDAEMVMFLLEQGADPHRVSSAGRTPLELATIFAEDELECAAALRRAMADATARVRLKAPTSIVRGPQMVSIGASLERALGDASADDTMPATGEEAGPERPRKQTVLLDVSGLSATAASALGAASAGADQTVAPAAVVASKQAVSCGCGPGEPMDGGSASTGAASAAAAIPPSAFAGGGGATAGAGGGLAGGGAVRSVEEEMAKLVLLHQSMAARQGEADAGSGANKRTVVFAGPAE